MFLVTGGSGFIGSAVIARLIKQGERVVSFSRSGMMERLQGLEKDLMVVQGDVTDFDLLKRTLAEFKVSRLVHLAFYTDIVRLEADPGKGLDVNCRGFLNVLEAARQAGVERVVWTSSAAVYGEAERYDRLPINEEAPFYPLNIYGAYKCWCEWMGEHYHDKLGVPNIVLRPTIVFGGGRWFRGSAPYAYDLFHGPVEGRKVAIDCGDQLIDWLYVKDLSNAVAAAGLGRWPRHRAFNICGSRCTVSEAAALVKKLEPAAEIEVRPGRRPMWVPHLDMTRAEEELGYKPSLSLEEAFGEYLGELKEARAVKSGP